MVMRIIMRFYFEGRRLWIFVNTWRLLPGWLWLYSEFISWTRGLKTRLLIKTWSTGCFVRVFVSSGCMFGFFCFVLGYKCWRKPFIFPLFVRRQGTRETFSTVALWDTVPWQVQLFPSVLKLLMSVCPCLTYSLLSHKCSNSSIGSSSSEKFVLSDR